jgi:hypothetical protein
MQSRIGAAVCLALAFLGVAASARAAPERPLVGVWITDLYDLDANNRSFTAKFWLWSVVPAGSKIKPLDTIIVTHARQFTASPPITIERSGMIWTQVAVTAVVRHHWDVAHFPFDGHELEIVLEDAEYDDASLQYTADVRQSGIDEHGLPRSWNLEGFSLSTRTTTYRTTFGDPALQAPRSRWSQAVARIEVKRDAVGMFVKLLIGAYVAVILALLSFRIKTDQPTLFSARLALLVGSLFATVVNLRSTEAVIGRSDHFTLVDKIHAVIAVYILGAALAAMMSRRDHDRERPEKAVRRDRLAMIVFAVSFVAVNAVLIGRAAMS